MPSCCLSKHTCLNERSRAMRQNGPYGWGIRCMDCIEGAARQMDRFTPEPEKEPYHGQRGTRRCRECGIPITYRNKSNICTPCKSAIYGDSP